MGANVALEMAGSGAFTGPVVLLAPSFSRRDEAMIIRVVDRLARVLGRLPFTAMRFDDAVRGEGQPAAAGATRRAGRGVAEERSGVHAPRHSPLPAVPRPARLRRPTVVRGGGAHLGRPRPDRRRRDHRRGASHPAGLPVDPASSPSPGRASSPPTRSPPSSPVSSSPHWPPAPNRRPTEARRTACTPGEHQSRGERHAQDLERKRAQRPGLRPGHGHQRPGRRLHRRLRHDPAGAFPRRAAARATRRQLPVPTLGLPLRRPDHRHLCRTGSRSTRRATPS